MAQPAMEERVAHFEGLVTGFDGRFDAIDRRFEVIDRRFDAIDAKVDRFREELCGRIDAQGTRMERHFQWTVGIMIGLWSTVVVAMIFQSA